MYVDPIAYTIIIFEFQPRKYWKKDRCYEQNFTALAIKHSSKSSIKFCRINLDAYPLRHSTHFITDFIECIG